jgi:hypothetical protein
LAVARQRAYGSLVLLHAPRVDGHMVPLGFALWSATMTTMLLAAIVTFIVVRAIRKAVADGTQRGIEQARPPLSVTRRGYGWHNPNDKRGRLARAHVSLVFTNHGGLPAADDIRNDTV